MKKYPVNILEIGLLTGRRAIAAAGLALVVSKKLSPKPLRRIYNLIGEAVC